MHVVVDGIVVGEKDMIEDNATAGSRSNRTNLP